jgi:hypothetical protein
MDNKLVCKWNSCNSTFTSRSELYQHLIAHIDAIALSAPKELKRTTSKSNKSTKTSKSKESSQSLVKIQDAASLKRPSSVSNANTGEKSSASINCSGSPSKKKKSKTKTNASESLDDIVCKYCLSPKWQMQNQIVMCDRCSNWYHQLCHIPMINDRFIRNVNAVWICKECTDAISGEREVGNSSSSLQV